MRDRANRSERLTPKSEAANPDEIRRTITYVENNPLPYHLPVQRYDFVTPYDNWPLHQGHSINSPYVKRLIAAGRYPHDRFH